MKMYDIIRKKNRGLELSNDEIKYFVDGFTSGDIENYYASALLTSVYINGMNERETVAMTLAMADSGDKVDLSLFGGKTVDKHSTGGVGDKTTLIVAPTAASLGCKVAKMSGRGLGHTGGTIDKLESIPGYKTTLSPNEFMNQVMKVGVSVIGQSGNLSPADKKIYALRDAIGAVDSIPLIASSIMSKKLAAGADSIVLDVKTGSGAFMKTVEEAKLLAREMVKIGKNCGRKTVAVITNMDIPLGNNIGNALEVEESVKVLKGEKRGDLRDICICLCANMVSMCMDMSFEEAQRQTAEEIDSGRAYDKFLEWVSCQGADTSVFDADSNFAKASYTKSIKAECSGYISHMDAEQIGACAAELGAGRKKMGGDIDFTAGIVLKLKTGDRVNKGDEIAVMQSSSVSDFSHAEKMFCNCLSFSDRLQQPSELIIDIVQ